MWSAVVCIALMQHVNNVFMEKKFHIIFLASLGVCCVCACYHILFGLFCPYAEGCPPAWLTDCLVGRTSPTSPCPLYGWLPSWISTRFKRWWEWKHLHVPCVPIHLCTIRTDPSKIFVSKPTWCAVFSYMFISVLYMFRAAMCPSSGELIISVRYLVYVTLCRWSLVCRSECILTCIPDCHLHGVTYTRYHTDTINSPDDGHMAAQNM